MTSNKKEVKIPEELPVTAKTQSPSCFLHSVILRSYAGEQAAYVYSCLKSQRKMSLIQVSAKTGIKGATLKKILVTLIQLGCVVYSKNMKTEQYFYSANDEGCWKLTYMDEIVRHIRQIFGQSHASVIQNIILRGHLTVGSYVKEVELKSEVESIENSFCDLLEDQWLTPVRDCDFKPLTEVFAECMRAANREFLANSAQFSKSDIDSGMGGSNGGNPRFKSAGMSQLKKNTIIKDLAKERFLRIINDNANKEKLFKIGSKSRDEGLDMAKGMSTLFSDDEDEIAESDKEIGGMKYLKRLNGTVPLTFSFERFLKHQRDEQLASISKHRIGNVTSMIYKVVLNRLQKNSRDVRNIEDITDKLVADASVGAGSAGSSTSGYDPSIGEDLKKRLELKDQEKGMNFGAVDILKELSMSNKYELKKDDLFGTIDNDDEEEYERNSKKRRAEQEAQSGSYKKSKLNEVASALKAFDDDDDDDEEKNATIDNGFDLNNTSESNTLIMLILQHLKLLTTDRKISFLVETSPGHFYVPYTVLQSQIPLYHMKQIIKNVLGNGTLRVLNCIEDKRLIEEKNIAKTVLMRDGDVRRIIATLCKFGIVEIQEIPRSADRNALRSVFAFKVNRHYLRSKRILGKCLMFNMGECLENIENMKLENRILLDKISREDVRGREAELLLESELKQLKKIVEDERTGMAKFQRLRILGETLWFTETV